MEVLRRIFGGIQPIKAKTQRLRWLGHISRLTENRVTNLMIEEGTGTMRRRGRFRRKWLVAVLEDIATLGVRNGMVATANKQRWRKLVGAIDHQGLYN